MRKNRTTVVWMVLLVCMLAACGASAEGGPGSLPMATTMPGSGERQAVSDTSKSGSPSLPQGQVPVPEDRMIIWNADMLMTVEDSQAAMDGVQQAARSLGGYTVSSESWLADEQLHARLVIRVPAAQFDAAMAQLKALALEVDRASAVSEDVTDQYVDLESRLRHLQAKEAQLTKFMDKAEDTEAVLAVYQELAAAQAEIEQVKGRMTYLEKLSAMATITVELSPKLAELPVVEEGWAPLRTLRNAARSLVGTLQSLGDVAIWFIAYVLPVLALLALPALLVVWIVRRLARRRGKQKA